MKMTNDGSVILANGATMPVSEFLTMRTDRFRNVLYWKLSKSTLELIYKPEGKPGYEVDLEQCRTSAEILDWIIQVSKKSFIDHHVIGDLVLALDACLDIQANYCSGGVELGPRTKANIKRFIKSISS